MRKDFFKEAFKGYHVPGNIKQISVEICNRFAIVGICDPMYIANVIAVENNIGDGKGNFTGKAIINPKETAKRIQKCYSSNILESEIGELEFCLINGFMDKEKAVDGLKAFSKRVEKETLNADFWRKQYLEILSGAIVESTEFFYSKSHMWIVSHHL